MSKVDPVTIASIEGIVRSIEERSSAEVVVEIRPCSGSYAHADQRFAAAAGFAALLFVLFVPFSFPPWLVPFAVGSSFAVGLLLSRSSSSIRRWMTTRREREANTRTAAAAAFVERGVANTHQESGVLVLLSLLERRIEIRADRGVLDAVPVLEWNQLMASAGSGGLEELSTALQALQVLLVRCLPASAGDGNELPDAVQVVLE